MTGAGPESSARILIVDDNAVDRERDPPPARRGATTCSRPRPRGTGSTPRARRRPTASCSIIGLPDRDGVGRDRGLPRARIAGADPHRAGQRERRGRGDEARRASTTSSRTTLTDDVLRRAVRHAVDTAGLERRIARQRQELERHVEQLAVRTHQLEAANAALRESEHRLRVVLEQLPAIAVDHRRRAEVPLHVRSGVPRPGHRPGQHRRRDGDRAPAGARSRRRELPGPRRRVACTTTCRGTTERCKPTSSRCTTRTGSIEGVIGFALDVTDSAAAGAAAAPGRRRWRRSACSPAASPTTSTTS